MQVTSKEANKLLSELVDEHSRLEKNENQSKTFLAAVGEDVESCRPKYDFEKMHNDIKTVEEKIIKLKHAINVFNTSTIVDGFNKTIDEMLIYIPQLTQLSIKLDRMQNVLPKEREMSNMRSTIIDYRYANYDIETVSKTYASVMEELHKAQIALDTINVTKKFEVEI